MSTGIESFPCAMIWSISFELQYPLSCKRPLARHVWFEVSSSNFQRGNFFTFGGLVWPTAFLPASVASKNTPAIERVLRVFTMSITLSPPVGAHNVHTREWNDSDLARVLLSRGALHSCTPALH